MIPIGETHDGRADMTNFEMDLFDTRMTPYRSEKERGEEEPGCCGSSRNRVIKPACLPISIVSLFIIALVFLPLFSDEDLDSPDKFASRCDVNGVCKLEMVETIPAGMRFAGGPDNRATHDAWIEMIDSANKTLEIAVMYWNLNETGFPTTTNGNAVYQALIRAGQRGVKIRIAQNNASHLSTQEEAFWLERQGLAQVRSLDFSVLMGNGVLHTKFLIADMRTLYVGSANMDWKSLSEVKELGAYIRHCPCLAADLYKVFAAYWRLGETTARLPITWPISFRPKHNLREPMNVSLDGRQTECFISSSPLPFNPKGRENDVDAIVGLITRAKRRVQVAVMDLLPTTLYMGANNTYWPVIEDALRAAAYRGVEVRLLVSHWPQSRSEMFVYLQSMEAANGAWPERNGQRGSIHAKVFTVPASEEQKKIPHARVNHNKYMVADDTAYIGTSNWAGDYFINTAGVGLAMRNGEAGSASARLLAVFERDWNSEYAKPIATLSL